jgi:dihydroneopterin triphosphate aldolase (PTPS-III) / 6-pyruvoyltetrahydropterin synthase
MCVAEPRQRGAEVNMFEILIKKSDMKFSCAHFIAYDNFREKLHGHNYNLTIKLIGKVEDEFLVFS